MWVVKLGGSLAQSAALPAWLDALASHGGGRAVVVPGGGPFADLVRAEQARAGFGDAPAHWMAILAMEQFGFMIGALEPRLCVAATEPELRAAWARGQVPVWLAYPMVVRDDTLPRDWSVSADSLALWLAIRLGAEALLLVKSLPAGSFPGRVGELRAAGIVDGHFPVLAPRYRGAVRVLGAGAAGELSSCLRTGTLPGVVVQVGSGGSGTERRTGPVGPVQE